MTDETKQDKMPQNSQLPATKGDLAEVQRGIHEEIQALRVEMRESHEEILHHFDVVLENLEHSFGRANTDEISLLRDKLDNHEERLAVVENMTMR